MNEKSTGRDSDKFMLRFPDGLRDRIKAEADENKRSMNAEIIARLESSFTPTGPTAEGALLVAMEAMSDALKAAVDGDNNAFNQATLRLKAGQEAYLARSKKKPD